MAISYYRKSKTVNTIVSISEKLTDIEDEDDFIEDEYEKKESYCNASLMN